MTARDRLALICIAVAGVLVLLWFAVVAPERKQSSQLAGQVQSARTELGSVQGEVAQAEQDKTRYASAYASVLRLGKAVPGTPEVPALLYQLEKASNGQNVDFSSITVGASSAGATASTASPSPTAASGSGAATPGSEGSGSGAFTSMPFTFVFEGSFFNLYSLLDQLDGFTTLTPSGALQVSGRLLTIQSVELKTGGAESATGSTGEMVGTVTATAYMLPGEASATSAPTSTSTSTAPAAAPAPASSGVASTPAVIGAPR